MEERDEEGEELTGVDLPFVAQVALKEEGEAGRRERLCAPPLPS